MTADNTHRVARIPMVIAAYEDAIGVQRGEEPPENYIASILVDMRHWCDANGIDFADRLALADEYHAEEA